jgi:hypothetical protein
MANQNMIIVLVGNPQSGDYRSIIKVKYRRIPDQGSPGTSPASSRNYRSGNSRVRESPATKFSVIHKGRFQAKVPEMLRYACIS